MAWVYTLLPKHFQTLSFLLPNKKVKKKKKRERERERERERVAVSPSFLALGNVSGNWLSVSLTNLLGLILDHDGAGYLLQDEARDGTETLALGREHADEELLALVVQLQTHHVELLHDKAHDKQSYDVIIIIEQKHDIPHTGHCVQSKKEM